MNSYHIAASIAASLLMTSPAVAAAPISGKWLTTERDSIIEIAPCDATRHTVLCGKIIRIFKTGADGKAMLDYNNPSPTLRTRTIQGINVLSAMSDGGTDWRGKIYDPRSGRSYKSIVVRNPNGNLSVQGCVTFICKSFVWTPAH
jgi:uncharacterized protein (DUF2147 family)